MKISDSSNYLIFKPVNYEFPDLNSNQKNIDYYDLNWLKIEFKYSKDGKEITEYDNCILTFEIQNFIGDCRRLSNKVKGKIESHFMEPYFEINVDNKNNVYELHIKYVYDTMDTRGWKYIEIIKDLDAFGFKKFINEIEKEFNFFPVR